MKRLLLTFFMAIFLSGIVLADSADSISSRPVTSLFSIETGHKNIIATYLSPLHYTGTDVGLAGAWTKAMPFNPEKAIMHFNAGMTFSSLLNPAQTAKMIGLNASFSWGLSWRRRLDAGFQATAGGIIGFDGGAYYLMRNGNNPVQAMANAYIGARGSVSKTIRIKNLPILLSDEVNIPSLSMFFSPGYGETYYEIYLGNHSGLCHAGWWGNNFRMNNLLSATLDFGRTSLMIGYRFGLDTQWANNLNTIARRHLFVIGVVPGGIGLSRHKAKLRSKSIYAIY